MSFVHFENVCKFYKMGETRIAAADHIGFDIEKGEFRCFRVDNFISEKAPAPTKPIYRRNILKRKRFLLTA